MQIIIELCYSNLLLRVNQIGIHDVQRNESACTYEQADVTMRILRAVR